MFPNAYDPEFNDDEILDNLVDSENEDDDDDDDLGGGVFLTPVRRTLLSSLIHWYGLF